MSDVIIFQQAWEVPDTTASTVVDVIIFLNDVNDNKPIFKKAHYYFTVKEGVSPGFVLADQFDASDLDVEVSALVNYCPSMIPLFQYKHLTLKYFG